MCADDHQESRILNGNRADFDAEEDPPGPRKRRGWVSFTVRFLISVTVLALLIRSVSWSEISSALGSASRRLLAVGSLFAVPIVLLKGVKWWLLLRHAGIAAAAEHGQREKKHEIDRQHDPDNGRDEVSDQFARFSPGDILLLKEIHGRPFVECVAKYAVH